MKPPVGAGAQRSFMSAHKNDSSDLKLAIDYPSSNSISWRRSPFRLSRTFNRSISSRGTSSSLSRKSRRPAGRMRRSSWRVCGLSVVQRPTRWRDSCRLVRNRPSADCVYSAVSRCCGRAPSASASSCSHKNVNYTQCSGSGYAGPYQRIADPDTDPDLFSSVFQNTNKKHFFLFKFAYNATYRGYIIILQR